MIQVSDAYKELVKSNIRPKCEPIIKVSGKDNDGNDIELIWRAKEIKDLKFKRSIDPIGRELPYMELSWTEIYTGKLNAENYPEKYNNIAKYMAVELSFVQDLSFYNTWKTLFKSGTTWKDLFTKTWKQVKNNVSQEIITMPKMYLNARPKISGKTITWTAKDLIYFLEDNHVESFDANVPFQNPLKVILLNSRSPFLKSKDIFNALTETCKIDFGDFGDLGKRIIVDDTTKNILKNYSNLRNLHWDFENDIILPKTYSELLNKENSFDFTGNIMLKYPEITRGVNVSQYSFKRNDVYEEPTKIYETTQSEASTIEFQHGMDTEIIDVCRYLYDGYGKGESIDAIETINYAVSLVFNSPVSVIPIKKKAFDEYINNNLIGEPFVENNPVNPYSSQDEFPKNRADVLVSYFNERNSTMNFECLPNVSITTGDRVSVETDLRDFEGNKIIKSGIVVDLELNYNGALKQKMVVHEVEYDN